MPSDVPDFDFEIFMAVAVELMRHPEKLQEYSPNKCLYAWYISMVDESEIPTKYDTDVIQFLIFNQTEEGREIAEHFRGESSDIIEFLEVEYSHLLLKS